MSKYYVCGCMRFFLFVNFLLAVTGLLQAQTMDVSTYQDQFMMNIRKCSESMRIDGILDESAWTGCQASSRFYLKYPNDKDTPARQTEARITYDDKYIYVGFTCWDTSFTLVQSLKRDIGHIDNDGVGVVLDPMNLHTTGFIFMVNAYNAQSEDQLSPNMNDEISWNWNNKWFSATQRYKDRWTAEMAIPFKSIRYPSNQSEWGINFVRVDMKNNQYSVWTRVPVNFRIYDLGYTGKLKWDVAPSTPGKNVVLIPFATGSADADREAGQSVQGGGAVGLDAKFTMNSSLNLDLTLNPDFSQVEVDRQVTNLTRFDVFFPERRSFFLENADIFGEYGIPTLIQPFYSRRIGLDNEGNRIPILGGARLSGSISPTTRIGAMSMQTGAKGSFAAQNYSAVSVNQNIFSRSVIRGYFLNRQSFMSEAEKQKTPLDAWGRNAGITLDLVSPSGKWSGWAAYHHSMKPGMSGKNGYAETGFMYNGNRLSTIVDLVNLGTNYYTDMGFVQRISNYDALRDTTIRVGFSHFFQETTLRWFPVEGPVSRQGIAAQSYIVFNPDNTLNERFNSLKYTLELKNTKMLKVELTNSLSNLLFPISFTGEAPLPVDQYVYNQGSMEYFSDSRKAVSYQLTARGGRFYNGNIVSFGGTLILRKRPYLNIELKGEYNKLSFPGAYGSTSLFLISPRVEVNFNTLISWTTFFQYNTQRNNFNINSRLQYRFRPMSDLFIVYTDNYFTDPFLRNKNRAIVCKLNYWLNL